MTLLGMLVLVLIGWGIERLIVTDTEAIEGLLEDARKAVLVRELPRLRPMMDDAFAWGELGPDETVQRLQGYVDRGRPTRIDVNWGPVVPRGDTCIVEADVRVLAFLQLQVPAFISEDPDHGVVDRWVPNATLGVGVLF